MLNTHLQRAGLITGSLLKNTSHSSLDVIKKWLLGQKQFTGGEGFLTFGVTYHSVSLVQGPVSPLLSKQEQQHLIKMVSVLQRNAIFKALMIRSIREQKFYVKINGVEVAMILDIKQPQYKRGADLKTTTCISLEQCIETARKYGYFRQGVTYKLGAKLKHFYFIFQMKVPPFSVFILDVSQFPEEEAYAMRELEFLLYFYKNYGKPILE